MEENEIFEALGVTPPENQATAEKQDQTENQAAAGDQAAAGEQDTAESQTSAGDQAAQDGQTAPDGEDTRREEPGEPAADPAADQEGRSQTEEQRREHAAQRRRQEQQAAIDQAVSEAREQERERNRKEWSDFFSRAGLKNSITGEPIKTMEEFNEWSRAYDAARISQDLKDGKLTPEALDKAIAESPAVKRAEELIRREEDARRQQEEAAAKARIDAEIAEIHKLDPTIGSMEDLLKMPDARKFYEYVRRGNSFLDAWYLTNREKMAQQTAEAARQQAMSAARSKDHLTATANARGAGAACVPTEDMRLFRLLNPDATEAEIQAYYNKQKKN